MSESVKKETVEANERVNERSKDANNGDGNQNGKKEESVEKVLTLTILFYL